MKLPQLFSRKKKALIGIDISSSAIKMIELSKDDDSYRVESYAVAGLTPNSVVEKAIADVNAVGDAIEVAWKRSGSKTRDVAVALPGGSVHTKKFKASADLSEEELEAQVEIELDQQVPYDIEEVNLDFEIIGPVEDEPNTNEIMVVAARTEEVDTRSDAVVLSGLEPKIVDVEAYALENSVKLLAGQLPNKGIAQVIAVFDIGATMTTLCVVKDLKSIYYRESIFGGKQLTEEIQRRFGLSYEEAGMAKKQGGLPETYVPEVLEPFMESMTQEINRSLNFFYAGTSHNSVDHIVLAGGSAAIANIDKMVEEKLSVSTMIANPFSEMSLSSNIKAQVLSNDAPSLMIACGLAMRGVD